ncbi:MAG: hypothetical protein VKI83_09995 [Synechococcaceae cyanobacterium]|nr:hypothetical protein [Synechococcaceae cyanobacterium]
MARRLHPSDHQTPHRRAVQPAGPQPQPAPQRSGRRAAALVLALLGAGGAAIGTPVQAAPQQEEFPPAQTFRTLQLAALACSRENSASTCSISLRQADTLLDHPLLPASCKDVLWEIRQRSVVAPANSISRRDRLDRSARDVTQVCRQQIKPAETKPAAPGPGPGGAKGGSAG